MPEQQEPHSYGTPKPMTVFISSPSDMQKERDKVFPVLERLNQHPVIRRRYHFVGLPYELLVPPEGGITPQKKIDTSMGNPGAADVYICIFGRRFGTPLEDEFHHPIKDPLTGYQYLSGTEYEFLQAYRARQTGATPTILLYRNITYEPDPQLRSFLDRFIGSKREFNGFFNEFTTPEMFEERLYTHLVTEYGTTKRWGVEDKPNTAGFVGRTRELRDVPTWIAQEGCRVVSLVAPGGVGKSALAAELLARMDADFEFLFWQTLQNKEPLEEVSPREGVLEPCLRFLSGAWDPIPNGTEARIEKLLEYLRRRRCLIVLDNAETIMQSDPDDQFQAGYEEYGRLIERLATTDHQSCLLITTRQQPGIIKDQALQGRVVRSVALDGLPDDEALALLKERLGAAAWTQLQMLATPDLSRLQAKLSGADWARVLDAAQHQATAAWAEATDAVRRAWVAVNRYFGGNPLALRVVASDVADILRHQEPVDLSVFIEQGSAASMRMKHLLERQIRQLRPSQQALLYWLAIRRQAVPPADLADALLPSPPRHEVRADLTRLQERHLVETRGDGKYTLQPVIIEHMTARLVDAMCTELDADPAQFDVFSHYPLITAYQTEDTVREHQRRLILNEVATHLLKPAHGSYDAVIARLKELLAWLRQNQRGIPSYAAGNVVNLLVHLQNGMDRDDVLCGCDCSGLSVWEAFLQGIHLRNADFRGANLKRSAFTEPFGTILSVTISPDGTRLVGGTGNGDLRFWDAVTGQPGAILTGEDGHAAEVWAVAFNREGTRLASGSEDRMVHIYEVFPTTGHVRLIASLPHRHPIRSVAFSPDGQVLATGGEGRAGIVSSEDNSIRLYRCLRVGGAGESWKYVATLCGHTSWIRSVAFSPDGRLLASGGEDRSVRIWNVAAPEEGRLLQQLHPHEGVIRSVAFSPDGQLLASASEDRTIRLWSSAGWTEAAQGARVTRGRKITWNEYRTLGKGQERRIRSLAFSPDGRRLVSGGDDATVWVWDTTTGEPTLMVGKGHKSWIWSVAYGIVPDHEGRLRAVVASGSEDQTVRVWDIETGRTLYVKEGQMSWIRSVAFSPDGRLLASGEDRLVRYWDMTAEGSHHTAPVCTMPKHGEEQAGHTGWVRAVAFHPSGNVLASCGEDHTVKLWATDGSHLGTLRGEGETNPVRAVAFSPDGTILAGAEDELIRLWDFSGDPHRDRVACRAVLGQSNGHQGPVWALAFSPDGKLLASAGEDRTIRLWDVVGRTCVSILTGHTSWVRSLAFSPRFDGRLYRYLPSMLASLVGHRSLLLASGGEDGTIRLWDVSRHPLRRPLSARSGSVRSVAFHPAGELLLSAEDRLIRLWDPRTGADLAALDGHRELVWSLAFSPDHKWLASGSSDLTIRVWEVSEAPVEMGDRRHMRQWRCVKIMQSERPYERMKIEGVQGISSAQKASLELLGAVMGMKGDI